MDALQMKHMETLKVGTVVQKTLQMKHMETLRVGTALQKKRGAVLGWILFK